MYDQTFLVTVLFVLDSLSIVTRKICYGGPMIHHNMKN